MTAMEQHSHFWSFNLCYKSFEGLSNRAGSRRRTILTWSISNFAEPERGQVDSGCQHSAAAVARIGEELLATVL